MTTGAIRCSTVTDPQAGEFCHQQPHNIALHRVGPQDRNECKPVRPERDLTFDGNAASSQTARPIRCSTVTDPQVQEFPKIRCSTI